MVRASRALLVCAWPRAPTRLQAAALETRKCGVSAPSRPQQPKSSSSSEHTCSTPRRSCLGAFGWPPAPGGTGPTGDTGGGLHPKDGLAREAATQEGMRSPRGQSDEVAFTQDLEPCRKVWGYWAMFETLTK